MNKVKQNLKLKENAIFNKPKISIFVSRDNS